MRRKVSAILLSLAMIFGIIVPAGAYQTENFSDVPPGHWAYDTVMQAADLGLVNGVGGGLYDPNGEVTVAQFLAMIGRALYPNECNEEGTVIWWDTYYDAALRNGVTTSTIYNKTDAVMSRTMSRNEMAWVLVQADEKVNGNPAVTVDTGTISDYDNIPNNYQYYAAQAYAKDLLTGDENGNFNGSNTLSRAAAATVIIRLLNANTGGNGDNGNGESSWYDPDEPLVIYQPQGETVTVTFTGRARAFFKGVNGEQYIGGIKLFMLHEDGRVLATTVSRDDRDEDGCNFTMVVELEKNDFAQNSYIYYIVATYVDENGNRHSNLHKTMQKGMHFAFSTGGDQFISLYSYKGSVLATAGHNNSDFPKKFE